MDIKLVELYRVPREKDPEERFFWYSLLDSPTFISLSTGWATGSAQVLRTIDGGKSWDNFYENGKRVPFSNTTDFFALNEKICWFISINPVLGCRSCVTKDGGKTWEVTSFGHRVFLHTVFFLNSEVGWLMGNNFIKPKEKACVQYMTTNGGKDWQFSETNISNRPQKAKFFDLERGWMLGNKILLKKNQTYSQILFTTDSGKTWGVSKTFDTAMLDFQILDEKTFVVAGENGKIFLSEDSGRNWTNIKSRIRTNLNAVHFKNKDFGIAVGDSGTIVIIKNGDVKVVKTKLGENFLGIQIFQNNQGFLTSNKAIYRFTLTE